MQFGDIFTDLQTKNITGGQCANTAEKYSSVVPLIYGNMSKLITNTNYKRINIIDTVFLKSQKKSHSTLRAKRATFTFRVDKS